MLLILIDILGLFAKISIGKSLETPTFLVKTKSNGFFFNSLAILKICSVNLQ